jgi:NADPH:quinone reductase
MNTMRAITMPAPGGPEALQLSELPVPEIQHPRQVRIRLHAAGVNPIDTKLRRNGTLFPEQMPAILGCDGAGVVESTGAEVDRFKPGDAVYFCHGGIGAAAGNYAEYIVIEDHCLAAKPARLDFVEAAAAPLVTLTAWEALHDRTQLAAGQTVLIHAGAGGVGHVAIQIARLAGARVATTVGSPDKAQFTEELGAELPIPYRELDFVDAVMGWTGGIGVDVAMDNVGAEVFQQTFPAVRFYGDLVTLLQPDNRVDWTIARERNLRISLEVMLTPMRFGLKEAERHQAGILERAADLFEQGKLRVMVSEILPLTEAATAHRLLEQGSTTGKIVLRID